MRDDLPYFSHDNNARRHPKMKALIAEFGFEGYGRFWALNERIAESSNACIDISKKVNRLDLANELGLDGNGLDSFLQFLSDPEIDLININDNIITTDRITELFGKAIENRERERGRKKGKTGKEDFPGGKVDFPAENIDFPPESGRKIIQNRIEENRQEEKKREETKPKTVFLDFVDQNKKPETKEDATKTFNRARELWNESGMKPECRNLIIPPAEYDVLQTFQHYSWAEIETAIKNYENHKKGRFGEGFRDPPPYGSLYGFLKTGVARYQDQGTIEQQFRTGPPPPEKTDNSQEMREREEKYKQWELETERFPGGMIGFKDFLKTRNEQA